MGKLRLAILLSVVFLFAFVGDLRVAPQAEDAATQQTSFEGLTSLTPCVGSTALAKKSKSSVGSLFSKSKKKKTKKSGKKKKGSSDGPSTLVFIFFAVILIPVMVFFIFKNLWALIGVWFGTAKAE